MEKISQLEKVKADNLLHETLSSLCEEGQRVGEIKSHIVIILAFARFAWAEISKYENEVVYLAYSKFISSSLEERKQMIRPYLSSIIGDAYSSMLKRKT